MMNVEKVSATTMESSGWSGEGSIFFFDKDLIDHRLIPFTRLFLHASDLMDLQHMKKIDSSILSVIID